MLRSESSMDSSSLTPTDRDGKILLINSMCDLNKVLQDYAIFMKQHNHGDVLEDKPDSLPVRPDESYSRRDDPNWPNQYTTDDQKAIDNYIRQNHVWKASVTAAVTAFLKMFTKEERITLELFMGQHNIYRMTRENLFQMVNMVKQHYGGWNSNKGDRNYIETNDIESFTTPELVHSGLFKLKELRTERIGWNDPQHLYPDEHYKTWLIQRMEDCPYLDHIRNEFEGNHNLDFDACQAKLLQKLAKDKDKRSSVNARLKSLSFKPTPTTTVVRDSTLNQYETNFAGMEEQFQSQVAAGPQQQQQHDHIRKCFRCGQTNHLQYNCPYPSRRSILPGQQGRGFPLPPQGRGHSTPQSGRGTTSQQSNRGNQWQSQGRGTHVQHSGRTPSTPPSFAQFAQWKQHQNYAQQPLTGNKRPNTGAAPPPAKRVAFKEPWPMKGPGQLQGSAGVIQDVDSHQQDSDFEIFQEYQDYRAYLAMSTSAQSDQYADDDAYTETPYSPPVTDPWDERDV